MDVCHKHRTNFNVSDQLTFPLKYKYGFLNHRCFTFAVYILYWSLCFTFHKRNIPVFSPPPQVVDKNKPELLWFFFFFIPLNKPFKSLKPSLVFRTLPRADLELHNLGIRDRSESVSVFWFASEQPLKTQVINITCMHKW